jgi:hypothetical protein
MKVEAQNFMPLLLIIQISDIYNGYLVVCDHF